MFKICTYTKKLTKSVQGFKLQLRAFPENRNYSKHHYLGVGDPQNGKIYHFFQQ